jgi:hypothetical protein
MNKLPDDKCSDKNTKTTEVRMGREVPIIKRHPVVILKRTPNARIRKRKRKSVRTGQAPWFDGLPLKIRLFGRPSFGDPRGHSKARVLPHSEEVPDCVACLQWQDQQNKPKKQLKQNSIKILL